MALPSDRENTAGNLPVDGALMLEFLPGSKQWILTLLSLWWAVGQVVASLISWVFLANYGCQTRESEARERASNIADVSLGSSGG